MNHTHTHLTRLAVLISGNGSNLQTILDACAARILPARVVLVVSNKTDAYGLERASHSGVPAVVKTKSKDQDRTTYDRELADLVGAYRPDWIVLAGWMRILSPAFLNAFPGQVINLHPALPGTFPGTNAIERSLHAFQLGEIQHTGVMVHLVPDEGVDNGPVLGQEIVPIYREDTRETLENRVHQVEHRLLVETLSNVIQKPLLMTRSEK